MKLKSGIIFLFSIVIVCFSACKNEVDEKNVPSIVVNAFKSNYPGANEVEWIRDHNIYEIDFELKNIDHSVRINKRGEIIQKKKDIKENELPPAIRKNINKEKDPLEDLEKVEMDDIYYYQIEYTDDRKIYDINGSVTYGLEYWK